MIKWLQETGAVPQTDWGNTDGITLFPSPSNRFAPDVWILIISLGLNSRHNIDFCLMGGDKRVRSCPRDGIYRKCLLLLSNLSKQSQKPQISKRASDSPFVLDLVFISLVTDRLENSSGRHMMWFLKWQLSSDFPTLVTSLEQEGWRFSRRYLREVHLLCCTTFALHS